MKIIYKIIDNIFIDLLNKHLLYLVNKIRGVFMKKILILCMTLIAFVVSCSSVSNKCELRYCSLLIKNEMNIKIKYKR